MTHPTSELTAWLDGALAASRADEVRRHVAVCAVCRADAQQLRDTLKVLAQLPPAPQPSAAFTSRLEARLRERQAHRPGWKAWLRGLRWRVAIPAGALAAAALVTSLSLRHTRGREWAVAEHLELLDDLEAVSSMGEVDRPDDALVIAQLDKLEREVRR